MTLSGVSCRTPRDLGATLAHRPGRADLLQVAVDSSRPGEKIEHARAEKPLTEAARSGGTVVWCSSAPPPGWLRRMPLVPVTEDNVTSFAVTLSAETVLRDNVHTMSASAENGGESHARRSSSWPPSRA